MEAGRSDMGGEFGGARTDAEVVRKGDYQRPADAQNLLRKLENVARDP